MKKFRDLAEAKDTIVFGFGRFNPPTTGHEKVIQKTVSVAGSNPYRIFPSHTQNPKKDPLPQALKTAYMRKMFKKYARNIVVTKSRNAIEIAVELYDQGYKNLVMVVGSDRVKVFDAMLKQYNGVEGKAHGYYKFDSIKIVSAGQRDPDAEGVEGMSASKMRAAAADGDMDSFLKGVPSGFADGKKLYRDVRKYMGIREERDMGDMTDFEAVRDAYLTGKIWNVGEIVESNGLSGEVVRKGTNYLSFMTEDGKVHKAWLHEIELEEIVEGLSIIVKDPKTKKKMQLAANQKVQWNGSNYETDGVTKKQVLVLRDGRKEVVMTKQQIEIGLKDGSFKIKDLGRVWQPEELGERNYRKEYDNYQGQPEQIARRSSRNKARRIMGDKTKIGMDVGHKDNDPMNNDPTNLRNEDPSKNRREPRLREEKIPNDDLNWIKTGGMVGKKRRFPSYVVKKEGNKYKAYDEQNKMSFKAGANSLEGLAKMLKPYIEKRTGSWKFEEVELDDALGDWYDKVMDKLDRTSHPKGWDKMLKQFVELMKTDKYKGNSHAAALDVVRQTRKVKARSFITYINKLVVKGVLPKELKAEYEVTEAKSPLQRLRDFDKSRVAVGQKPIFKDKGTKIVRMKKRGQLTIMNVPSDEVDKYSRKGYKPVKEEWSFKDFVDQIQEDKQTKKPK